MRHFIKQMRREVVGYIKSSIWSYAGATTQLVRQVANQLGNRGKPRAQIAFSAALTRNHPYTKATFDGCGDQCGQMQHIRAFGVCTHPLGQNLRNGIIKFDKYTVT